MNEHIIELYITGNSNRSEIAINCIQKLCESELKSGYKLEVIDVIEMPDIAEKEKVLATPTLIKRIPPPVRRLVGDLSDIEKVKYYLDIK